MLGSDVGCHFTILPIRDGKAITLFIYKDCGRKSSTKPKLVVHASWKAVLNDCKGWGKEFKDLLKIYNLFVEFYFPG